MALLRLALLPLLLALLSTPAARLTAGENWPQFRGPGGDGHADSARLPVKWSESQNILWKTPIHDKGWSSPVVWGDQVWLNTAMEDGRAMFVLCIDRNTGRILHDKKLIEVENPGFCPDLNSYASPTPAVEEGRVYVHFGSYGTACLDSKTCETLWMRQDLPCDHWRAPGSSPILQDDLLIVSLDGFDHQYVVALDKKTGETVWRTNRNYAYKNPDNGDIKKAFSTPQVIEVDNRSLVISPSAQATSAYDAQTGKEVWQVNHGGMNAAARPIFSQGMLYVTTGAGGWKMFAVRPEGQGDVSESHVAWKFGRSVPSRSSLLAVDDLIYMVDNGGVGSCIDAKTSDVVWSKRITGDYCASPIYADGRIYFFSQQGHATVIRAGREYEVLAVNQLDEGCMASPAVTGDALLLRTKTHLYRIESK